MRYVNDDGDTHSGVVGPLRLSFSEWIDEDSGPREEGPLHFDEAQIKGAFRGRISQPRNPSADEAGRIIAGFQFGDARMDIEDVPVADVVRFLALASLAIDQFQRDAAEIRSKAVPHQPQHA